MGFYIRYETHQDGPFDLVTMIRKIRKGLIPPETLVMEEKEPQAQAARLHPQLNSFYREMEDDYVSDDAMNVMSQLTFSAMMDYGWDFFTNNLVVGMLSAILIFAILCFSIIILLAAQGSVLPSILLITIASTFFLCGFLHMLQRLQRQLPFSLEALMRFYSHYGTNVMLFSCAFALLMASGFAFFIIPGIILLSYTAFAPILVVDRNYHFWHAIEASYRTVKKHGSKLYPIMLGLVGLNLLASLMIFPLIVTLPVTFVGVLELYNKLDFS